MAIPAGLNPQERDPSRAYRIISSRLQALEARPSLVATGSVTLTPSATSTIVTNGEVLAGDQVFISPQSAAGATAVAHVSAATDGQFTITHDSSAATDRNVGWLAIRTP